MVAQYVELRRLLRGEALHEPRHEVVWVEELVATPEWEGKGEIVHLTKAEEDVHDSAAGTLVDLQENDVGLGFAHFLKEGVFYLPTIPQGHHICRDFCPAREQSFFQLCPVEVICPQELSCIEHGVFD